MQAGGVVDVRMSERHNDHIVALEVNHVFGQCFGNHICCFVPGGRSLVTVGMPGVTNTSQFKSRSSLMFALLNSVSSLLPLFPRDLLPDIGWAIEEFSSFILTYA